MLNLKRERYIQTEDLEYVQVAWSIQEAGRFAGKALLAGFGIALALGLITRPYWSHIEGWYLHQQEQKLSEQLAAQTQILTKLEQRLDRIQNNDRSYYKSILNLKPIDESVWQSGVGGSVEKENRIALVEKNHQIADRLQHKIKLQQVSFVEIARHAEKKTAELKHIPAIRPCDGRVVSHFGYRSDPFHGGGQFHPGVDLSARIGTPIKATGDGRVVAAGPFHGYGIHVEIDHGFGYRTIYAHLSKTKVRVGEKVKRGTVVGLSGNTGYSTGPHLHYEVIKNGQKSNPLDYIYVE